MVISFYPASAGFFYVHFGTNLKNWVNLIRKKARQERNLKTNQNILYPGDMRNPKDSNFYRIIIFSNGSTPKESNIVGTQHVYRIMTSSKSKNMKIRYAVSQNYLSNILYKLKSVGSIFLPNF